MGSQSQYNRGQRFRENCRALSLTGHEDTPDDLRTCQRLKNTDRVIL